jgi:integrase
MTVSDTRKYNRGESKGKWRPKSEWSDVPWRVNYADPTKRSGRADQFFATKVEADAFDAKKKEERRTGVHVDEKAGQQLVEVYVWAWLASVNLKPRSLKRYESAIRKHILPSFGKARMIEVQRTDVNTWIKQKVQAGYAPATVHHMYDVLAGMFKAAVIDQVRGTTPCVKISNLPPMPKRSNKKRKWLPTHLQAMALARTFAPRYRLAILVAAGCGLRFGEVMGLTTEDFDTKNRVVRVRRQLSEDCECRACMQTTKSLSSVRDVDMPASVAKAVKAHIDAGYVRTLTMTDHTVAVSPGQAPVVRDMQMMFTTATGKPITRSAWSGLWNAAVTAAGEILADAPRGRTGFTLHTLRHFYGSLLIAGGANVVEVQEAMGHSSPVITLNEYSWPTGKRRALALVDAAFGDDEMDLAA